MIKDSKRFIRLETLYDADDVRLYMDDEDITEEGIFTDDEITEMCGYLARCIAGNDWKGNSTKAGSKSVSLELGGRSIRLEFYLTGVKEFHDDLISAGIPMDTARDDYENDQVAMLAYSDLLISDRVNVYLM